MEKEVEIVFFDRTLKGLLSVPEKAKGMVIFAHGSGSSRLSPRNRFVASKINKNGFATLLFDLLTPAEDFEYMNRFNIDLLSKRLEFVTKWVDENEDTKELPIGYFGASTGAAAALVSAAGLKPLVKAVVSRGGRPDLTQDSTLLCVECPVLLIVGGDDRLVIDLNKSSYEKIHSKVKEFNIIKGASHLFEEEGTLEQVAMLAVDWFRRYLDGQSNTPQSQQ